MALEFREFDKEWTFGFRRAEVDELKNKQSKLPIGSLAESAHRN